MLNAQVKINADELQALVLQYKYWSNGPLDIVQDKGGPIANGELMIDALYSTVCAIMQ
jgi:hypothetical protein